MVWLMNESRKEFSKAINFLKLTAISISNSFLNFKMRDSSVALIPLELNLISQFYWLAESTLQLIQTIFFIFININIKIQSATIKTNYTLFKI